MQEEDTAEKGEIYEDGRTETDTGVGQDFCQE